MLADDVKHLMDVVGRMDCDRQIAFLCCLGRLAHQGNGTGLDFARHYDSAYKVFVLAVVAVNEFECEGKLPLPGSLVGHTDKLASVTTDPAATVKARPEIGADAKLAYDLEQRLLDAQLASELHESRDAIA